MTAILEITDGTISIDLINPAIGIHLNEWTPQVIGLKGGGTVQSSPLAEGSRLVNAVFGDAIETFDIKVDGLSQDELIERMTDLFEILEKMIDYWATDYQNTPVYIKAQASCETNPRYALIKNYSIPQLANPYAQPFLQARGNAVFDEIDLILTRGHWLALPPGQSACTSGAAQQDWEYGLWTTLDNSTPNLAAIILESTTGNIFMGDRSGASDARILRSIDDGDTWAVNFTLPALGSRSLIISMTQLNNGNILAGNNDDGQIYRTTDDGATAWTIVGTIANCDTVWALLTLANGNVLAGYFNNSTSTNKIARSIDGGASWSDVDDFGTDLGSPGPIHGLLFQASNGWILASPGDSVSPLGTIVIHRSKDNGTTWPDITSIAEAASDGPGQAIETSNNRIVFITSLNSFYSDDFGDSWIRGDFSNVTGNVHINTLEQSSTNNLLYMITVPSTVFAWVSSDEGVSWSIEDTAVPGSTGSILTDRLLEIDTGRMILSKATDIVARDFIGPLSLGSSDSCVSRAYVGNKHNIANLTDVLVEDNSLVSFTNIFPITSPPVDLFPDPAANNDTIYFGIRPSTFNSGPFASVVLNIGQQLIFGAPGDTITWQYSTGGGVWAALTVQDNTGDFKVAGINSIHWEQPSNWATNTVNSIAAFWVRARLTGTLSQVPQQLSGDIYSIVTSGVDVAAANVAGDIPALMRMKLTNESDNDGPGGSGPDLYSQRVVAGLRTQSRGSSFIPYLNCSDEQNPTDVTVAVGTNAAFQNDLTAPTGRSVRYTSGLNDPMASRVTFTLGAGVASDYYGTFHVFLRCALISGGGVNMDMRLQVETGSGGVVFTTRTRNIQTGTAWEVIDYGQIRIPVGNLLQTEIGDTIEIRVQTNSTASGNQIDFYDLVLIPVDEWAMDAVDRANSSSSYIGGIDSIRRFLDVDSLVDLRSEIRTIVKDENERVNSIYNPVSSGPAILQANTRQVLWFLSMYTSAVDTSLFSWISEPEIAHSIEIFRNQRYLGMRGAE